MGCKPQTKVPCPGPAPGDAVLPWASPPCLAAEPGPSLGGGGRRGALAGLAVLLADLWLCLSLQLNSLGPDACQVIRDLLLHDKCAVSSLR